MRSDRIKKTLVAVFFGRGLVAIRQLALVPILLGIWDENYYGAWLLVSAIPSFLAMSNLGLGSSAAIKIALESGAGRPGNAWSTFLTAGAIIAGIGTVVTLVAAAWAIWWPSAALREAGIENVPWVLGLLLGALFLRMLAQPLGGFWNGLGKASQAIHYNNIAYIGEFVLSLAIPLMGGRALALSAGLGAWTLLWVIGFAVATCRLADGGRYLRRRWRFDAGEGWRLLHTGMGYQIGPLWQALIFQGSLFVAGAVLGSAGVALWGSLRIVARSGNQLLELISQSLSPEFQISFGQGDQSGMRRLHSSGLVASLALSSAMAVGLLIVGPFIFQFWTHHAFEVPFMAWVLVAAGLIPFALWWISGEVQRARNEPWMLNLCGVACAVAALGVMMSGKWLGVTGLALGAFVFDAAMAVLVLPRTLRLLEDPLGRCLSRGGSELATRGRRWFSRFGPTLPPA